MKFYVYQHIREDKNEIFYVGVGTRNKQDLQCNTYSRAYAKHVDNFIWLKIVAKTKWRFEIVASFETREEALQKEVELIALYGRKCDNSGILANLTLGGEANTGYCHTEQARLKISQSLKGKTRGYSNVVYTPELKAKLSEKQKEVANRPDRIEFRRNIAKGNKYHFGCKHSDESKRKMSEAAKNRGLNCKTVPCELLDVINNLSWKANTIAELASICPLSLSTVSRMSQGIKISERINKQYKFKKI